MSKERELLKRVRDTLRELEETHYDLYWDIQAELDLDEQEPVAWIYEWAVRSSFDGSFTGEWKEEFSRIKPDGTVKGFNPTKLESTIRNLVPLYTAPQKREPLSDEKINAIDLPEKQSTLRELVRLIEKAHGIGETK